MQLAEKEALIISIGSFVAKAVASATKELIARIAVLEATQPLRGAPGIDGAPGEQGLPGKDGVDGVGLAGAVIDRNGELVVTLTDGTAKNLGLIVGRDGENGKDGVSVRLDAVVESVVDELSKAPLAKSIENYAPDDVATSVALAVKMMAEVPPIVSSHVEPSTVLNINLSSNERQRPRSKTITTRKDKDGNLVADVVEQEVA